MGGERYGQREAALQVDGGGTFSLLSAECERPAQREGEGLFVILGRSPRRGSSCAVRDGSGHSANHLDSYHTALRDASADEVYVAVQGCLAFRVRVASLCEDEPSIAIRGRSRRRGRSRIWERVGGKVRIGRGTRTKEGRACRE